LQWGFSSSCPYRNSGAHQLSSEISREKKGGTLSLLALALTFAFLAFVAFKAFSLAFPLVFAFALALVFASLESFLTVALPSVTFEFLRGRLVIFFIIIVAFRLLFFVLIIISYFADKYTQSKKGDQEEEIPPFIEYSAPENYRELLAEKQGTARADAHEVEKRAKMKNFLTETLNTDKIEQVSLEDLKRQIEGEGMIKRI